MTTFNLTITLGNDAMQTGEDVARALHSAAYHIEQHDSGLAIYDDNGNRVGSFGYSEPESAEDALSAERKAIASMLMHQADRMTSEVTQAGYYAAAAMVRDRERAAVRIARGENTL